MSWLGRTVGGWFGRFFGGVGPGPQPSVPTAVGWAARAIEIVLRANGVIEPDTREATAAAALVDDSSCSLELDDVPGMIVTMVEPEGSVMLESERAGVVVVTLAEPGVCYLGDVMPIYDRTDRQLVLKFVSKTNAPIDVSAMRIDFEWYDRQAGFLVKKSTAPTPGGITLKPGTTNVALVEITAKDTAVQQSIQAMYRVRVTDVNGKVDVWAWGRLPIEFTG